MSDRSNFKPRERVDPSTFGKLHALDVHHFASQPKGPTFGGLGAFRPDLELNLGVGYRTSADGQHTIVWACKLDPNKPSPPFLTPAIKEELRRFLNKYNWGANNKLTILDEVGISVNNPRPWSQK